MIKQLSYKNMRTWLFGWALLLNAMLGFTQNSNHWINLNQTYYRFSIPQSGVYRISAQELQQAGITGSFSPQNIQLFQNGQEIPIYIKGESIGLTEYIEFYAVKNNGWLDIEMYNKPENQSNPYYSLITDTAAVFLTWNSNFNNKRYSLETDQNFAGYTPVPYGYYQSLVQYTGVFYHSHAGCKYIQGEGYVDNIMLSMGTSINKKIPTPNFVNAAAQTQIDLSLLSRSTLAHHLQISGPGIFIDTIYQNYQTIKINKKISNQLLSAETQLTFTSVNDLGVSADNSAVSYISITYPRSFDMLDQNRYEFTLAASPTKKTYIEFTQIDANANYVLYDILRGIKLTVVKNATKLQALVPASNESVKLVLTKESALLKTSQVSKLAMVSHANKNKERIIISHPTLWNAAQSYAIYRNAYLINIEELYNQFGYGIRKHPMAIRNFLAYALTNWEIKPTGLLIIGDGMDAITYRNNPTYYERCLIPPMGNPATDELLGAGFQGSTIASIIPIARIAARTETEVSDYLDKLQTFEQNQPEAWMKQICHFGGGINSTEQDRFKKYLKSYESTISDSLFGGYVSTFLKTSSDPIAISKTDSITNLINNGVSLMTFFGHGSSTGFDQNIDEPNVYNNTGKYPLIFANSCYSGNIFLPNANSASDRWILIPNKGAIAFLAMVNEGVAYYLNLFASVFYKQLTKDSYGETLGTIINKTKKIIQTSDDPGYYTTSTIEEFTLHGDPWIVLNSFDKPDLLIENKDVFFTPRNLSNEIDSFLIHIAPTNIARSTNQSFLVELVRWFEDGSSETFQEEIKGLLFKDTITIKLPIDFIKGQGNNQFLVTLDIMNQVEELSESNNSVMVNAFIASTDLKPVVPYQYSLWPDNNPTLKINTGNALANEQLSIFQIDTSYLFNSGALYQEEVVHAGGVIEWNPPVSFNPNQPYYWRAAKKTTPEKENWAQSSFLIENGKTGFHQSSMGQMVNNKLQFIEIDLLQEKFEFSTTPKTLTCHNIGGIGTNFYLVNFSLDGNGGNGSCGAVPALIVAVIDSTNLDIWRSDHGNYGHANYEKCPGRVTYDNYFVFHIADTANIDPQMDNLVNFINNQVPDGHYFLIYSFMAGKYQLWRERHFAAFQEWGSSDDFRFLDNLQPFIFFAQKGSINKTHEVNGNLNEEINLTVELKTNTNYGTITSPTIGPAKQWNELSWDIDEVEPNLSDEYYLKVMSEDALGVLSVLIDSITEKNLDISSISAASNPNLRLQLFTRDELNKTPVQLNYWKINYEPVGDLAINAQRGWLFESDTLPEGAFGILALSFENIGSVTIDSSLIKYWIQDASNREIPLESHWISSLEAGAYTSDTISFNTRLLQGNTRIWAELNPLNQSDPNMVRKEQYHFNNLAQKNFYVKPDETNPLLDVTFDGTHIMDGDLVSAKPEIVIQLIDENPYIALDDTTLVSVYLKSQQTGIEEKIDLKSNEAITFLPANLPDNKAQIIYQPTFSSDGIYELRVQAKDASGNESGMYDYNISFTIINESTITQVFNYPNPFSTSTRFVFELTGSEIPDELRIDILTITGKVVKVIYADDLGLITIGKNISPYAWNGTDMYGDPLANGVYFYRVAARINGQEIKIRDTGTNQFFKNGFGKMYLMR